MPSEFMEIVLLDHQLMESKIAVKKYITKQRFA